MLAGHVVTRAGYHEVLMIDYGTTNGLYSDVCCLFYSILILPYMYSSITRGRVIREGGDACGRVGIGSSYNHVISF